MASYEYVDRYGKVWHWTDDRGDAYALSSPDHGGQFTAHYVQADYGPLRLRADVDREEITDLRARLAVYENVARLVLERGGELFRAAVAALPKPGGSDGGR